MRILLAEKINGAWQRVAVLRVGAKSGSYNLPAKCQGQPSGTAAKAAVNQFRAESAALEVNLTFGAMDFRATRF